MLKVIFIFLVLVGSLTTVLWYSKEILKFFKQNWKFISVVLFAAIAAFLITFI